MTGCEQAFVSVPTGTLLSDWFMSTSFCCLICKHDNRSDSEDIYELVLMFNTLMTVIIWIYVDFMAVELSKNVR